MRGNRAVYAWSLQCTLIGALLLALSFFGNMGWIAGPLLWIFVVIYCAFTWIILNNDMKWWTKDVQALREFEAYVRATREGAANELKEKKL